MYKFHWTVANLPDFGRKKKMQPQIDQIDAFWILMGKMKEAPEGFHYWEKR